MAFSTACLDWQDRLIEGRSIIPAPIFEDEGERGLRVFKSLKLVDAPMVVDAGTGLMRYQTLGEVGEEWLFELVRAIFGAYDAASSRQLITEVFLLISKKNGKSTIAAAIMLTALILNWRHFQELTILAPTIEVANNAFGPAKGMVEADDDLKDLMHVQIAQRSITHRNTKAVLKVLAADSGTVSGSKSGFVLVDELWVFGTWPDADAMLREATGGLVARPEGFIIWLSTQSDKEPAGVFKSKLQYFRDVRDGVIFDPKSLPVLYEFPDDMVEAKAFMEPDNFYITNPNIGRSVQADWLLEELNKVRNAAGGELQVFLAKHLNVEIGLRLAHDRWRGADHWLDAVEPGLTVEAILARSEVVTMGFDGGGMDDLLGAALIGRERGRRRWLISAHAFAHPSILDRRKDISTRLLEFEEEGSLTFADVDTDMAALTAWVEPIVASGLLPEKNAAGFDPNNISLVIEALLAAEVTTEQLKRILQGPALTPAINMLPRKLADRSALHGGSAMLAWCVGNAKVERRGNAVMITKQVSGTAKIDPVIALLNAAIPMSWNPEAKADDGFAAYLRHMGVKA